MSLYAKALAYQEAGFSVIPLKKDKKPLLSSWLEFQKTPATAEVIEEWWLRYPDANVGIVTGKISGITVIDIDTKGETVVPLDTFPQTYTVKTPSGGYHLYYQYDPEIKQTANTYPQFPHVDIRNDGGYVVAGGSVSVNDVLYEVVVKMKPQPFPRDLFIDKKKKSPTKLGKKITDLSDLKEGDGRNNAMCSLLGTMLRGQPVMKYPAIKDSFFEIALSMKNPLPQGELDSIWNSIGGRAVETANVVDLEANEKGIAYTNLENIRKILEGDENFKGRVVFDTFLQTYMYKDVGGGKYREMHDSDEVTLTREISVRYPDLAMISLKTVGFALMEYARAHAVDSALDYLRGIVWDKTPRVDTWLCETYGVEDNPYHRAVGSNWLKGLARRAVEPGCKFDYVLVLEGEQGTRKSTSLGILGGDWHVETTAAPDNKDFLMLLQGNLIIEFSEGETLSRGEIKQLKALITTQYDKFRAPYERYVQVHPRRCVFAMTTNQTEYLKDETGNRRWLPVTVVGEANVEWLRTNRDQLLAEALYRVEILKETTYEFSDETLAEQAKRQVSDPNEERIAEWYASLNQDQWNAGVTVDMVHRSALNQLSGMIAKREQMEIANVLKNHLGLVKKPVMIKGVRYARWFPADMKDEDQLFLSTKEVELRF